MKTRASRSGGKHLQRQLQTLAEAEAKSLLAALPPDIREKVLALPIIFEPAPGPELVRGGIEPDVLGLFLGDPYAQADNDPVSPEILLFLSNLWDDAGEDVAEFRRQVRKTLLHEIGHYLGLEEDGLAARNME